MNIKFDGLYLFIFYFLFDFLIFNLQLKKFEYNIFTQKTLNIK